MDTQHKFRIHPLVAGAAVAVIIASAVGVAAMTDSLPGSNAAPSTAQPLAAAPPVPAAPAPVVAPAPALSPSQKIAEEALATTQTPPPPAPVAQAAPPAPACTNCGVVESVEPYRIKPKNSTVGMIGGAVVGGLVGNQIGDGGVNTLATLGGAAGGAYVGNEIGKKMEKGRLRYKVTLRMDDGRTRTVTYANPPAYAVGTHVRLENGKMLPA
jgi:outer membrane lipoprotein SlyB